MDPVPAAGRYDFGVRDVDAWWEKLRHRAEVVEPLFDTSYGTRTFTVKDPEGTSSVSSARTDDGTRFGCADRTSR